MDQIKNKIIMITGGAGGLGTNFAELLLRNGAKHVAIVDLNASVGLTFAETLEKQFGKGKAVFFQCDVTKKDQLRETYKKVVDKFNGLDIVINNAGVLNEENYELTISLNLTGLVHSTYIALEYMSKHKGGNGGTIVNVASILGLSVMRTVPVYTATKHGVIGFTRSIKDHSEKTGVRFLVLCPGATVTPLLTCIGNGLHELSSQAELDEDIATFVTQKTEAVAEGLVALIKNGKNGAVWVSENDEPPFEVTFEHYAKNAVKG